MIDEFYTHFRFKPINVTDRRTIGVARFTKKRTHYPASAIVKISKNNPDSHTEIRLAELCQTHENTVKLYAYYLTPRQSVLFMEHCERGSLDQVLVSQEEKSRIFPERKLLHMMLDVAEAVHSLHEARIVHRDIKPHNVFVTRSFKCKIGDFETAKVVLEGQDGDLQSNVMGTVAYMSPEKLASFTSRTDMKTTSNAQAFKEDLWALGRTFFEMAVGKIETNEWITDTPDFSVLQKRVKRKIKERNYSESMANLIYRLLTLNSHSRIYSSDVCIELASMLASLPEKPKSVTVVLWPTCVSCHQTSETAGEILSLGCPHLYCNKCLAVLISTRAAEECVRSLEEIGCAVCQHPIPSHMLMDPGRNLSVVSRHQLVRLEIFNAKRTCECGETFDLVKIRDGVKKPYTYKCKNCHITACSWCGEPNGHTILGVCKKFRKYMSH